MRKTSTDNRPFTAVRSTFDADLKTIEPKKPFPPESETGDDFLAPCQTACPAGIDVPAYVALTALGRYEEAISIIRETNPFPWVCGLVCTRPCEFSCVRGYMDTPIAIKSLKGFLAEQVMAKGSYKNPEKQPDKNKKVCVVGAGPGGLSAAYYLALNGYQVQVLESLPEPGGMITVGIPRYRLPMEVIKREVAMLEQLGVEFVYNTTFGRDINLEQLKTDGYAAIFLAIGAHKAMDMGIKGECDYSGVMDAIRLLKDTALGIKRSLGNKVVVIGGGNVAIDAARTALRLGSEDVTIAYRRSREEMPADDEEIEHAEQEGIKFCYLTIPVCVQGKDGSLSALECVKAELVETPGRKRKSPVPIEGSNHCIDVDTVIAAIGQKVDYQCLSHMEELDLTAWGTIRVNDKTGESSVQGVFAAGDAVTGPATVIEAIAGGRRAAESIDRYLSDTMTETTASGLIHKSRIELAPVSSAEKTQLKKPVMPLLDMPRRKNSFDMVELGYDEATAQKEALRCLRCDICSRCGTCVDICTNKMGVEALQLGYLDPENVTRTDLEITKKKCIACGACAENCPTGAMDITDDQGERVLSLCGTELNRKKMETCASCDIPLGTEDYLGYIQGKLEQSGFLQHNHLRLCPDCAKAKSAELFGINC